MFNTYYVVSASDSPGTSVHLNHDFTGEEIEAQEKRVACPQSHRLEAADWTPGLCGSHAPRLWPHLSSHLSQSSSEVSENGSESPKHIGTRALRGPCRAWAEPDSQCLQGARSRPIGTHGDTGRYNAAGALGLRHRQRL